MKESSGCEIKEVMSRNDDGRSDASKLTPLGRHFFRGRKKEIQREKFFDSPTEREKCFGPLSMRKKVCLSVSYFSRKENQKTKSIRLYLDWKKIL